ncbi:MAG: hypothetical protein HY513_03500 [Candidatus Aenigmarchaeota archaeon]|nr:hypothetical protein [Candidatus Aenigmarchaeota archaeon]
MKVHYFAAALAALAMSMPGCKNSQNESHEIVKKELRIKDGVILYQSDPTAKNHIYVIGQAHRPAVDVSHVDETTSIVVASQLQAYTIAKNLENVGSLLIEGCAIDRDLKQFYEKFHDRHDISLRLGFFDNGEREQEHVLSSLLETIPGEPVNDATAMIYERYNFLSPKGFETSEDAIDRMIELEPNLTDSKAYLEWKYLHNVRSCFLLGNGPKIGKSEYQSGRAKSADALSIVGYVHLPAIIEYSKRGKCELDPPTGSVYPKVDQTLDMQGYGVVVIVPDVLYNDFKDMERQFP